MRVPAVLAGGQHCTNLRTYCLAQMQQRPQQTLRKDLPLQAFAFRVSGKVQGVFFRQCTVEEAVKQDVVGWVRNELDGSVAGEVQGQEKGVSYMKDWLQNRGSPASVIEFCDIHNERELESLEFKAFDVKRGR